MEQNIKNAAHDVFVTMGASNHADHDRQEDDFYATDPKAMELLLEQEKFSHYVWEPACGQGHLSKVLEQHGYNVTSTDLVYRGYGEKTSVDFLATEFEPFYGDIVTNPPYKNALEFVEKAYDIVENGYKVAMFLRLQFLEGKRRREFFEKHPPKTVYVFSSRIRCAMNGDFDRYPDSAVAFTWFVWEKGFKGNPIIKWIN